MGNLGGISAFPSTCHLRIAYFLDQLPHRTCLKKREIGFKCKEEMGIPNNCIAFDDFFLYLYTKQTKLQIFKSPYIQTASNILSRNIQS